MISKLTFPQNLKAKLLIILFFSAIQIYAKAEDPKIVGGEATAYPASVCSGQHAVIRLKDYKGTTIRWQRDSAGTFVFIYPLVQTDSLVTPALTVESKYRALVSTLDLLLFDSSTVATVSITPFSVGGTIKSTSYTVCAGESVTVSLNNDHVGNKIQWQLDSTNLGFVNISGAESASYTSPPLTKSTIFRAAITNSPCGPDNTNTASITVTPASKGGTAKTVSNINNTVCKGSTVDLTVTGYVGTDFKWLVDSTGSSYQEIAGATGHNYTTMPITKTMRFKVRVQNANCTEDFSSVVEIYAATTSVGGETSPDTAICKGGVAKITLKGYQGSIQWQIDSTGSFVDIPGAHGTPYNATGLTKTSKFKAIVTSAGCNPDPSTITVVTVNPVPNPGSVVADNATICFNTGTNINLNGATAGATIQWQKNPPTGFADIANATTTPYSTGNLTVDTKFRAVVSLGACSAISNVATVSITSLPSPGTAKADDTTVCNGTGTHVKLTNAASGVQITWQSKTSGAFADIANSNTADYVTGNLTTTTSYRAFVKKNNCTDTSNIVTVVVKPVPSGGSAVTAADSICSGSSTVINLNGATNGATIQWEKKTASTYDPIPGANTAPYNTGSLTTTTWFHAKISVGSCSVYSGETRVLIKAKPVGGTISPGNTLLCTGKSLSLKLNNSSGQIQWQKNDSGTFEDLVGEIDDTYQTPNLSKTTKYRAILKNATCPNDTSKVITITISPLSKGGDAYATPASICNNLKSVVRVQNFVGSSIQWQKKLSNGSFQNVSGLTDSIFTTPALTTTTTYQAVVTSGACASATSLPVTINVSPAADGGDAVADSTNVCYNTGTAIRLQNYSGASIQWQSDESAPGNFSDIAGAHSNVYLATNLKKTTSFKAIVKNDTCPSSESTIATVTVIPKTLAGTLSANPKKVCSGSTAKLTLASYTPGAQIKWMKNIGNNNFQVIPGATGNEYTTINLTEDTEYKAIVRYGHCDSAFSNAVTVQITTQDGGDALASPGTICSGTSSTLSLTGQTGSYKWQQYDGSNFVDIPGAKHDTAYKIPSLIATTIFRAYVSGGSCPDVTSNEVTVTVTPPSKGGKAKPDKNKYSVCSGTNTSISLTQYDGTIDWQVDNSGTGTGPFLDVNPISHLTKYTTPNLTQKTRYRAKVTRSGCAPAYSDTVTISIDPASVAGTLEYSSSTICSGGTVTFSVKDYAGTIQWQCDTSNSFQNISATGTPYTTFPITKNTTFRALVTNGSCSSVYVDAPITVAPALSGGKAVATTSTICSGSQTTIHLRNYTGQIQWQTNNGTTNFQDIPNAHDSLYTTPALTIETKYRAILSSGTCPTATSEEATVSILSASKGGKATANPSTICSNTTTTITLSQYVGAIQWQVDSTNVFKDIAGQNAPTLTTPRLTKNTSFRAVVTSNGCDPDNSTTAFVSVTPASYGGVATPVQSSVCSGGTATINLTKEIGTLIQWQKDSLGWVDIPNATGKSLSIVLTQTTRFRARVRNGTCNMANSNVVEITITPTLKGGTAKATPSSICSGTTTTIKLTGNTGSLIQWQMNKGNGYVDMANQTDSILVTPQLFYPASTSFRAHVNGSGCPQVTSTVATVTTIPLSVAGTVSATPSKICSGDNSVLKLTGNTGTIQWQSDEGGNGFIDIPGQTNATYTTPALNTSTSYKAVVTSGSCPSEKTAAALVTVVPSSLSGFAKATPATVCNGGTSKLSVTGYTGDKFQWQVYSSGNFVNINGATNPDYTTPSLSQDTDYRVLVTNGDCSPSISNTITVKITSVLNGGTASANPSTICRGTYATIKLIGQSGSIQWQTNNGVAGGQFKDITINGNGNTLITPNLTIPTTYRAVLSSGGCTPEYSNEVTISIIPSSVGGTATPKFPTVCSGQTDTIKLTGNTGSIQWQRDSSGTFVNIPGATASFYVTPPLTEPSTYRAMVTSSGCSPTPSTEAMVSVAPASQGGTITASATKVCTNATSTLTLNGYIGSIQWQSDVNGGNFSDIPGATGMSYTTFPITKPTHFKAVVTNGGCPGVPSNVVLISITPALSGGTTSANPSTVCYGSSSTLTLKDHSGSVRWQRKVSGSWMDIDTTLAIDTFYVTPPLFVETQYRAFVSSKGCPSQTSTETTVAVVPGSTSGTAAALASNICEGETATLKLTGSTGAIQWQIKDAVGNFSNIALATSNTYTTLALTKPTSYRAIVTNGSCTPDTSNTVLISLIPPSVGGIPVAAAPTVCRGGTTTIQLTKYTGDNIKWQRDSAHFFVDIPGAIGVVYSTPPLADSARYRAIVSNKGCHMVTSAEITIQVTDQLEGGVASVVPATVCNNTTTTLILKNYKGSIQWQADTGNGFKNITGATTTPYVTAPITVKTNFLAVVSSGSCPTVYSQVVTADVTQNLNPGIITATPSNICGGQSVKLKIIGHTGNVQWQVDSSSNGKFVNITGQTADTCRIPAVLKNTLYRAKVSSGACTPVFTDSILITVNVVQTPTGDTVQKFCSILVPTVKNLVTKDVTTDTIKWYSVPTGGIALTSSTPLVDNGTYYAARATSSGCETYNRLKVKVTIFKSANIVNQPASVTTCPGSNAQFVAKGDGTGLTYRWMVDVTGTNTNYKYITDNSTYKGSTTDTLKITGVTDVFNSYYYKCVVKGTCSAADSAVSNQAVLLVSSNTTVNQQPESIITCYGNVIDFIVKASGNNSLVYQWQVDSTNTGVYVDLKTDTLYLSATDDTLRIKAFLPIMAKYKFRCVVKNLICKTSINSQDATVSFDEECNVYPVDIPTGFSPNGDGVNDKLVIQGLENYPGAVVRVFNIWGDLVYEKADYQNDWDAKANVNVIGESKLPAGTYYIAVDLKKGAKRKATFLIIKY